MKRILVLGGSRQAEEGLRHLKTCGFELVVCDMDPSAPGFIHADYKLIASVYHLEQCLPAAVEFNRHTSLDGVMCLACDVPHIVARIAEKLELQSISIEAADLTVNKLAMKDRFTATGVAVPDYLAVSKSLDLIGLLARWGKVVVKPVDSRGSKGVSLLDSNGDTVWAYTYAKENSPSGQVIAEQFLSGPQVSTESIVIDGQAVTPAMSDRSYEFLDRFAPFIVENGGDMPSSLPVSVKVEIADLINRSANALGITNGIVKGDVVVHEGKPYIIELAARLSGGYFCTHQIPFSTGIKLVEASARIAVGERLNPNDWSAKQHKPVSTRWLIPPKGKVIGFADVETVCAIDGVLAFEHWTEVGDKNTSAMNAAASVAMVQATGNTTIEAIKNAESALDAFAICVEPV